MALLERETGTTLVERRSGGVRLTDAGKRPEGARLCEFVAWGVPVQFGTDTNGAER